MAPNRSRARSRAGRRGHSGRVSKSGVATHISNIPNLASEAVSSRHTTRGGRRGRISRRGTTRGRPNVPSRVTLDSDMEASDITLVSSESESEPMSLDDGSSLSGFITDGNISTCYDDVESISDKDCHEPVRSDYGSGSNDSHKENLPWVSAVQETKEQTKVVVPQLQQNKQHKVQNTEQNVQKMQQGRYKTEEISLKRKQEVLDVEQLMDVVRAEVPAMSSDLLSHLEGILKRTDADNLLAKMVRTVATFTMRQQPITRYFPKINQDINKAKENGINEENNANSIKDKIDDATTAAIPNTSQTSCFLNQSPNVQDRPSWDVASTSRQDCTMQDIAEGYSRQSPNVPDRLSLDVASTSRQDCTMRDISEDSDSSTSTRFPTPTEDDDDLDSLFPPITIPQKLTPSIRMNTSFDSYRSRGNRGRRGGASRPWRGRGRGRRGWGEEDEESKPDVFSTSLAEILSAGGTPHRLDIEERAPKRTGPLQVANVGVEEEMGVAETYADYVPARLTYGRPHPDRVVETASLSSVDSIEIQYQLSVPQATIEEGLLSALQLEAVVYASQAHQNVLPDGTRAGFLIGDGAGVGKGRTVAGIIFENYLKGRKRHVWVSVSNDLKYDAERDLKDIGAGDKIPVYALNKMTYNAISSVSNGHVSEGVVFSTYSSLIGYTTAASTNFKKRLQQLIDWCGPGFDGCIVFDECHRAKNLCPGGSTDSSKTGVAVFKLQESLPLARVVYASATGASEPRNMAYMVRLGLWGQGTPFHTFKDFLQAVEKRGVGAMEIVAMDMKLRGMYIARQLSFHGVSFKIEEVPLSAAFRDTYDKAVELWVSAKKVFEVSVDLVNASRKWRKVMWAQFWGAHQRFFKYLCIAAKVGRTVECAKQAVAEGKCVVVGLQSTGEARTLDQLERDRGKLTQFICTAKGVFDSLVQKQFPCPDNMTEPEDYENGFPSPSITKETNDMCTKLLQDIASLGPHLPPNTLDQLLDELGGTDNVAEMTGRKGRVVQNDKGKIVYESRTEADVPLETLNLTEKQRFMDGDKDIAIISEAASSGISLQSDRRAKNQKRRVHITLELPWSADRAIQQFGRTHRSNQVNAPEYIFLISDLAGERRFASTVAKRLESLGALTHGDRRATETRDLSQFNIENKHGRQALRRMMRGLYGSEPALVPPPTAYPGDFLTEAPAAMRDVGLEMGPDDTSTNIARFLNRLLGVKVKLQNALFQYFSDTFDAVVQEAKRSGRFDMGILDLGASGQAVRAVARGRYLRAHATGTAPVELHTVHLERGFEWERAVRKYQEHRNQRADPDEGFYISRTKAVGRDNAILCLAHSAARELTGRNRLFQVYRPNMGLSLRPELLNELLNKYMKSSPERCERAWRDHYQQSLTTCTHAWWLSHCSNIGCEVGLRTRTYHVLSGSVLAVWARVEAVYSELHLLNQMQVVRIKTDRGLKIVGMVIPKYCVDLLKQQLRSGAVSVEEDCTT